jgi:enamine deaminase RidA (YjgF/YER057c/UK114 family)
MRHDVPATGKRPSSAHAVLTTEAPGGTFVGSTNEAGQVKYINPKTLHQNRAFTQVVNVPAPSRTVYIGAQHAVDATGAIVGKDDLVAQTEQVLKNVEACLEAADATVDDLIQWSIFVAQGQPLQPAFEVFMRWWGNRPNPPANTVMFVAGFARPEFLVAIEGVAAVVE